MWFRALFLAFVGSLAGLPNYTPVSASSTNRGGRGPSFRGIDDCPSSCVQAGPSPGNWSLYHSLDQLSNCPETLFFDVSLLDPVDDSASLHRLYTCSVGGGDWTYRPNPSPVVPAVQTNKTYELGWWTYDPSLISSAKGQANVAGIVALSREMRRYLTNGHATVDRPEILFARIGNVVMGLYIGRALQNQGTGGAALGALERSLSSKFGNPTAMAGVSSADGIAMQLCSPDSDGDHIFGVVVTTNGTFATIQNSLSSLSKAGCLSQFGGSVNITAPAYIITPQLPSKFNSTAGNNATNIARSVLDHPLLPRADCKTIQVVFGDSCGSLATKCGISGSDFTKYNPGASFCSSLVPYQHVCCSAGTLPDFAPKPNADGSCATYTVVTDDTCADIAAANSLTVTQLQSFNKNTWAFNGCSNLWVGTIICLSSGDPPMPAPVANALCGPQVPGTTKPPKGTDISKLNPCPLNACCDVWGQCGTTTEFCTNTSTGAPGTAQPGTNGCISNCGTDIVFSDAPAVFRRIAYFQGYNLDRPCLYMDSSQIDPSKYTHLHYAFATLSPEYEVLIGNQLSAYEFQKFLSIKGPKRILTFGGWDFSTNPQTYQIFRNAVTAANRVTVAHKIADFINKSGLDGVDIDWEYPGAPDIPGIPPGTKDDGTNYLAFLVILRNLLGPNKSISIAAASSYWYLRGFPIDQIADVVDYVVFLTYDLHGQWDAGNAYTNPGCATGNCLRSGVNRTETINSLSLITKAGVPSNKVVVGVTSYGRSFQMSTPGCTTELCTFTGTAANSNADPGICTGTAGFLGDAEINAILQDASRVTQHYVDAASDTDILVYDEIQWVGYMSESRKTTRAALYQSLKMGGTTDWAIDLQTYRDVPKGDKGWSNWILAINAGLDPSYEGDRGGNWTDLLCTDPVITQSQRYTPAEQWQMLDCQDAWDDAVQTWRDLYRDEGGSTFSRVIAEIFRYPITDCGELDDGGCNSFQQCNMDAGTGPAGSLVWNSLVTTHLVGQPVLSIHYLCLVEYPSYKDHFTPVPKDDDKPLQILLDFIGIFGAIAGASYFNSYLKALPSSIASGDTVKDGTLALIAGGVSIAKDLASGDSDAWTAEDQDDLEAYLGQVIFAWQNVTEITLDQVFNGADANIDILGRIIAGGRLVLGRSAGQTNNGPLTPPNTTSADLTLTAEKAFWGFTIPLGWQLSGTHGFIIDSGFACDTSGNPLSGYMTDDVEKKTKYCHSNRLYYLVAAKGDGEFCDGDGGCADILFQLPPGLDQLDGTAYGGLTLDKLVQGAINTYEANNNKNGGSPPDIGSIDSMNAFLMADITIAGYVRLPVCSAKLAHFNWDLALADSSILKDPTYPCMPAKGEDYCGDSTFEDQTSDASPLVSDCLQIAANIAVEGDWTTLTTQGQRQLLTSGSCQFGVERSGSLNGNANFIVGNRDVIDVITSSVNMFGGSGRVGAKGTMSCQGNIKGQSVLWGLY
ncbi:chitinase [Xylaria flabelliformis]|nr:chitinase [Xylaria flabelliformis]